MVYKDVRQLVLDVKNIVTGIKDLETKTKINDLVNAMYELQDENRNLREENHKLKNAQMLSTRLIFRGNAYYDGEEGPYCSACWDSKNRLVRIVTSGNGWNKFLSGKCPDCKNSITTDIKDPNYRKRP